MATAGTLVSFHSAVVFGYVCVFVLKRRNKARTAHSDYVHNFLIFESGNLIRVIQTQALGSDVQAYCEPGFPQHILL